MKPIDDELLIVAINATTRHYRCCADNWGEREACYCRDACGDRFQHVETDYIRRRAINLRKAGRLESAVGKAKRKRKEEPAGKYAAYLQTEHWKEYRADVLAFWGHECCLCSAKAVDVHHRHYLTVGREQLTDCVPLCRSCHIRVHGVMPSGNDAMNGGGNGHLF